MLYMHSFACNLYIQNYVAIYEQLAIFNSHFPFPAKFNDFFHDQFKIFHD